MNSLSRFVRAGTVTVLFLLGAVLAYGQGTDLGIIRGTVTDAQGGVIAGAAVVITDTATDIKVERTTDALGNYEVPNLKFGTYKVTVNYTGFNTAEVVNVVLRGTSTVRVDVRLTPRTVAEQITVTTEAPLIQMEAPVISATLSTQQILDLPRDSRDIYQFLYLNPNITYNPEHGFKFIGSQSYGANFALDGQRATGAGFGQAIGGQPSLETIGELTVLSNSFTAEYAGIANIRVSTKRGGKEYHGSLFYDNKNSALAAWTIDDKIAKANFLPTYAVPEFPRPTFNFTEAGGSFGGPLPVSREKTFFQFAYEHRWSARPVRWRATNLPHQSVINGDFRRVADSRKPAVPADVSLTPAEIATNTITVAGTQRFVTIPSRLFSPYTTALFKKYFPVTSLDAPINANNGRLVEYAATTKGLTTRPLYTGRIDHDFSDRDKVYGVVNTMYPDGTFSAYASPFTSLGTLVSEQSNHTVSLSWNHSFSPRLINEARGGFNYQSTYRRARIKVAEFLTSLGFNQEDINAYAAVVGPDAPKQWGTIPITYGSQFVGFPSGGRNAHRPLDQKMFSFGDTLSWVKGRHSVRAGFDLVHNHVLDGFTLGRGQPRGQVVYTGPANDLGPLVRLLLGLPANSVASNVAARGSMDVTNWEQGFFFQDDFRIHERLTLNLGLRYELLTPFVEANDLLVNFDTGYRSGDKRGRFVVPSQATISRIDPRMVAFGVVTAKEAGVGRGLIRTDKNNLAPRLGVAYRFTDRTVFRGGWGLFYPTSAAQGMRDSMATNPFNQTIRRNARAEAPLSSWPRPFTGGVVAALSGAPAMNAYAFDVQAPRIQQYNVTVERELPWKSALRFSYLGTRMSGLLAGYDHNMLPPNEIPFGVTTGDGVTICDPTGADEDRPCDLSPADDARLAFPGLGDWLVTYGNIARGFSNALQIEFNRRMSGGFVFNASYTLLSQKSSGVDVNSSLGSTLWDQFKPDQDLSRDSFVSRHRFIAYGSYDLPVGRGRQFGSSMNKVLDGIVGGWQTSFNMFIKNGTGFTPYWDCDNCFPVAPGNIASSALDATGGFGGGFRPLVVGDPNKKSGDKIWDAAAFAPPPVGTDLFSNPKIAKRNFLTGPGTWAANFGLTKYFQIHEKMRLSFRAVFDNLFNHPLLSPVGDNSIANLGSFSIDIDQKTGKLLPIGSANITANPDFARLRSSYSQEGMDNRRSVRLSLRLTF